MSRWKPQPNLENASIQELRATYNSAKTATQTRCMAIIMLGTGISHEQVSETLDITLDTLYKWINKFNKSGIDGLITKPRSGAPRKIPEKSRSTIIQDIKKPEVANRTFWTAKAFHGFIKKKYEIECSYATVVRFLHSEGFGLKVPQPWPDRQDDEKREAFIKKLQELLNDANIEVWFGDESGVEGEPKPKRRWAKKGEKIKVIKNGDHIRTNILGLVSPRTGEFFSIIASHTDSDVFQAFLDEAAKCIKPTRKRNILILDNASWHKKKSLNWHFFEPLYLPPYSPDLNPIERLWLILKAEWFNNIHCKTVEKLIERTSKAILSLINKPEQIVKTTAINLNY